MKPLDMIRAYAEPNGHRQALSIFPCWGVSQEGICECPKGTTCTSPGKHPIPSNGLKAATRNIDQLCQWWAAHPNANLGIPTGRANGLLVIDVDNGPDKHGDENLMALEASLGRLPVTWESLTGGGGRHLFFQYPVGLDVRNSAGKLALNIDVRAEGGYVIAEPSRHASGRIYAWETTHMPEDIPLAQLPMSWLNALSGPHTTPPAQQPVPQARFELPDTIPVGQRNDVLFKLAASMRAGGVQEGAALETLHKVNTERCKPPLPSEEVEMVHRSTLRYPKGQPPVYIKGTSPIPSVSDAMVHELMSIHPEKNDRYAWNDIGNGNLFADLYKLRTRYVPERSKWAVFDGRIWQFDLGGLAVMQLCKELSDSLMAYALTVTDEKTRQEYMRFLSRWQRRSFRETILKDAASVYPLPFAAFDRDPMLFNCLNGTLNLDNGHFSPHRPEDYLSKLSGVTFDPAARCERWEQFIDEVMQDDAGKARFLQKALGYALTGDARHECFFILYGPSSRNGKGTTMETFARLMGDYGKSAKPDTIAQRQTANGSGPSEDIARLIGARFVNVSEPDKKMVLSAALVKTLTGRDTVTARFLHENSIEFRPEFKLFINSNYLPQVTDVTLFSSGRVMVIPFERHFREDEQDRDLKDILAQPESLSGILNWALAGLRGVIDEGLNPPGAIRLATDEYRERSDKIGRFVAEVLEEHPLGEVRMSEVFTRYQSWCIANGIRSESAPNFNAQLKSYGLIEKRRPAGSARSANAVSLLTGFRLAPNPYSGFINAEAGYAR